MRAGHRLRAGSSLPYQASGAAQAGRGEHPKSPGTIWSASGRRRCQPGQGARRQGTPPNRRDCSRHVRVSFESFVQTQARSHDPAHLVASLVLDLRFEVDDCCEDVGLVGVDDERQLAIRDFGKGIIGRGPDALLGVWEEESS